MQTMGSVHLGRSPTTTTNAFFYYYLDMGKSKSGGTRTFIRGRVGSDVYSVGRDAKGKKQQVVRSIAESVANPQTQSQMRGRMIMSTIAQAVAALRPIVDHAFDNVVGARANLAEFTSRNYALIKADVAAHPSTGNKFGLNAYQEKGAKQGCYVVANGQAVIPAALVLTKADGIIVITLPVDSVTIGGLKSALGMTSEEYFTLVGLQSNGYAAYERFRVNPTLAAETAISAANIADVFAVEGNATASITVADNVITITLASVANCCAVIVSKKANGKYIHNEAVLGDGSNFAAPSDTALPTYPVGAQNYLNGGDIFGMSESFNPGDEPSPSPSPTQSRLSSVTVNGASLAKTGSVQLQAGSNALVIGITAGTDSASYAVAAIASANAVIGQAVAAGDQTAVAGSSVNLTVQGDATQSAKKVVLVRDNVITEVWGTLTQPAAPQPTGDAALTALSSGQDSILADNANYYSFDQDFEVQGAGTDLAGATLVLISDTSKNVGDTINVSEVAANQKHELTSNSFSGLSYRVTEADHRFYLVVNNQVVQKCGTASYSND